MSKLKEILKDWRWPDYGVMLLIFIFAAFNKMMPITMGVTALSLFFIRNDISDIKRLLSPRYPFVWFIIFFLVHVVGLINTENMDFAVADIGMKASLIGIPIFLILTKLRLRMETMVLGYLGALLFALLICYAYAVFRSFDAPEDNHWAYFTESYFSFLMHRSYFATYLALGTLIAVYKFFVSTKGRAYYLLIGIILLISTVLTFSKAGILILVVLMIPMAYYLIARYYSRTYGLIAVGVFAGVFAITVVSSSTLTTRFKFMVSGLVNNQTTSNTTIESSASRMIMWSTSMQLFSENALVGVGTGDVRDELDKRNAELGNTGVVEHSLNSHNQYLNTSVQLGLLGLIPLLLAMITALVVAIRKRHLILFMTVSAFMLTMLFESFLETQAGLIPVTLFTLVLTLRLLDSPEKNVQIEKD